MTDTNKTTEKKNDTLAFIIGGLFILGLVFATYNYFNETGKLGSEEDENGAISLEKLKETLSTRTSTKDENRDTSVEAGKTEENPAIGSLEKGETTTTEWTANQYEEGDLKAGAYTVQYGDTLWEIAEAVYGNGAMWTNILSANSSSIGFLPNGQQALIYAGQTITIPAL
jgi:nucleoid-associated protein YgaU